VKLPAETTRHLGVLGIAEGSEVVLFDGAGREMLARVESIARDSASAIIIGSRMPGAASSVVVTLACAVPKGRRTDVLVRMCAELGVARIVPLLSRRSIVKLPEGDASSHKLDRWKKICLAAAEQSGRNVVTAIAPAMSLPRLLEDASAFDIAVLLSPDESAPSLSALLEPRRGAKSILLLVGPEGGFTDEETGLCLKSGAKPARLTRSILRIETACVAAVTVAIVSLSE
jgi:16S rRNA (uracil1498-N3)-methyltransferase